MFLRTTQCVAGKSNGKGGAWCLQSSWKSYAETCSTIFADSDCNYKMSNVMVKGLFQPKWFSEYCGLFSVSPLRFSWMMVLWKEAKGMAVLDHTCKKYCFSEQFFLLLLLKSSNISASFSGPAVQDHRGVLWWEPVFCIRSDGLSFNIHQPWAASLS